MIVLSWSRALRALLQSTLALCSVLGPGCNPLSELPPGRVCDEVGYAISNRTVNCTGDQKLAVSRYERFKKEYTCRAGPNTEEPVRSFYTCPANIMKLTCDQVLAFGDDLEQWLLVDEVCGEFLSHADGRPIEYREGGAYEYPDSGSDVTLDGGGQ